MSSEFYAFVSWHTGHEYYGHMRAEPKPGIIKRMGDGERESSVDVVVRVRPLNRFENRQGARKLCEYKTVNEVLCGSQSFTFDRVFGTGATQREVFYGKINSVIDRFLVDGRNATVMAYGQTSSGKSFTMTGEEGPKTGIIPRAVSRITAYYRGRISVSYVEIYLEKVYDLFGERRLLSISGDGAMPTATVLHFHNDSNRASWGISSEAGDTTGRILEALRNAAALRSTGATKMNQTSSRSHSIVTLSLDDVVSQPKLTLIDLAGSETIRKSGAAGNALKEAASINKSLSNLSLVLNAFSKPVAKRHIPFRESKLTQMLQRSLTADSKVCLIITCSPAPEHKCETLNSLRFGERAKHIQMEPGSLHNDRLRRELLDWSVRLDAEITHWILHGATKPHQWLSLQNFPLKNASCSWMSMPDPMYSDPDLGAVEGHRVSASLLDAERRILECQNRQRVLAAERDRIKPQIRLLDRTTNRRSPEPLEWRLQSSDGQFKDSGSRLKRKS